MQQNRVVLIAIAVVAALGFSNCKVFGGDRDPLASIADKPMSGDTAYEKELLVAGPLGDMTLGKRNAPITVIEYASLTCSHCAEFDMDTFPEFKADYIDTGKVYYILRDFPFDPLATAAFMLAHCAGPERYFGFVDVLFRQQTQWAFSDTPMERLTPMDGLKAIARLGGISEDSFNTCMKNRKIFDHVKWVAERGVKEFGVNSTPTFFINGEKVEGALSYPDFESALKKHLSEVNKPN